MGTVHTLHPDIHDHGLADGCPRCEELASHPAALDRHACDAILERLRGGLAPRSLNERRAMERLAAREEIEA